MSEQDVTRLLGYAETAIDLLKRASIVPTSEFYELLHRYSTGTDPVLNARMDQLFGAGIPTAAEVESLCSEFRKPEDSAAELGDISERIAGRIKSVHETIASAMASANVYSSSLEAAGGELGVGMSPENVRAMANRLLAESREMLSVNHQLKENLQASRLDMEALQADLEDLRHQSVLDPLTMIHNRKYLDEALREAVEQAQLYSSPLSLLMIDIDHFKKFNDTWGHQTGDQVLRLVASTIKKQLGEDDILARFGGEEFIAILPGADLSAGLTVADRARVSLESKELLRRSTEERLGRITASFGVATCVPGDTPASLIERADQCLYAAKRAGRNRVVSDRLEEPLAV